MIFNIEEQTAIKFAAITKGYALAYRKIWESLSATDREKLLNRGLLASREYGTIELTLPRFGRFAKLQLTYEEE